METALALWHGINLPPLMLSGLSLLAGSFLVAAWHRLQPTLNAMNTAASRFGPEAGYFRFMEGGISQVAGWQTRILQNGVLGTYLLVLVLVTFSLTGFTLLTRHGLQLDFDFSDSFFLRMGGHRAADCRGDGFCLCHPIPPWFCGFAGGGCRIWCGPDFHSLQCPPGPGHYPTAGGDPHRYPAGAGAVSVAAFANCLPPGNDTGTCLSQCLQAW